MSSNVKISGFEYIYTFLKVSGQKFELKFKLF